MELWDLYDANGAALHRTHKRGVPLEKGTYHLGVDIWTINTRGEILLTLRSPEKDDLPNEWENTAGSVLAGETALEGAMRELREETGIIAEPEAFKLINYRVEGSTLASTYLLHSNVRLSQLTMQPGETVDAIWVSPACLDEMVSRPTGARPVASRWRLLREKVMDAIASLP